MSRVQILTLSPPLTLPSQIVCGDIGDENHGFLCGIKHGVTLPQDEVLQVSTVPTRVKDSVDLVLLPFTTAF